MSNRWPMLIAALTLLGASARPAATRTTDDIIRSIEAGTDPARIAAELDDSVVDDRDWLNSLRLRLKATGRAADARRLLDALAERHDTDAVRYNLSLAYVDQLAGRNLLQQGNLSTSSIRVIDEILSRQPADWLALQIRGLNNLYWPDWFGRSGQARVDLTRAVAAGRRLLTEHPDQDGVAWSYLALGDALALLDEPAKARSTWAEGAHVYPYFAPFAARLALDDATQHAAVRAARDSAKPIDTDIRDLETVSAPGQKIELVGGELYGPGPLEDQPLHPGRLSDVRLARPLTGIIPQMNDGTAEPHLPGEIAVGKVLNGLFSDGTPANKNVDVGHVVLMNGKFKLFLAALDGGPNHGHVHFYLDRFWNWTIQDDIGIDPGFAAGVIKFDNFTFSTSPRLLPLSTQTQQREPGGIDRAGSLASGAIVAGSLGDENGKLGGIFNAIGSFPMDSVLLPGAPFAQTRVFQTDIAMEPEVLGFLTLANAIAYLRAGAASEATGTDAAWLERCFYRRLSLAMQHFEKAPAWLGSLDTEARAAYERLTAPLQSFEGARKAGFVCGADSDLTVLGTRLDLVRSDKDASRLAGLVPCEAL